jgi:hypothetical protein
VHRVTRSGSHNNELRRRLHAAIVFNVPQSGTFLIRKLLLATAALVALAVPGNAAVIADLGINPTSAQGDFSNSVGGALFDDQYTFMLVGGPGFFTIASATNVFPGGPTTTDFITNFTASVFSNPDGIVGNGDDVAVIGPVAATTGCGPIVNCQGMAGQAILNAGNFDLDIAGQGGGTSGYGGNLSTAPVPGPILGAGIPGLIAACGGLFGLNLLRRRRNAAV